MKCLYCGNNYAPHRLLWFNETMMVCFTPFNRWLANRWFYALADSVADKLLLSFAYTLKFVGALKFNYERSKFTIPRGGVLWDEAIRRGYKMANAEIFGKQIDFYRVELPKKSFHFSGLPRPKAGGKSLTWLDDKAILKEKLLAAGIAVPLGRACTSWTRAKEIFSTLSKPVIVKPRLGSRARHSTTNIFTLDELRKAFLIAKQLCHWVVVEEMLMGNVYRGTVIDGKLVGVMGLSPPQIVGDGISTVKELINKKNSNRPESVGEIKIDNNLESYIIRKNISLDTVLPTGQNLVLGPRIGPPYGGTSFEITDTVHLQLVKELEKAAAIVNDPIIGFDFIIPNPAEDPAKQKWGIIEANGLPFLQLHHFPLYGNPNNVAKHVWDMFDLPLTK